VKTRFWQNVETCFDSAFEDALGNVLARDEIHIFYISQTKILEGGTKDEMWLFEALLKGESTRCGPLTMESDSKSRISSFVPPSKIFVWRA